MIHQLLNLTRPLFVLDTETTGVDSNVDRIVEIGFQMWDASGMTKEWRSLVNPGVPIPAASTKVHGITDETVNACRRCGNPLESHPIGKADETTVAFCLEPSPVPRFKDLASSLAKGLSECDFAGKNVRFDLRILAAEMSRAGQPWSYAGARIVDADRLEQIAVPRSLGDLYEKYVESECLACDGTGGTMTQMCVTCDGLGKVRRKHDGAHGALSDVRASVAVVVGQLAAHSILPRDLDALHAAQWPGWIDTEGKFRFVDGVPCFSRWGKHGGKPMNHPDVARVQRGGSYWDFILTDKGFSEEIKAIASAAKLGRYPAE